MPQLTSPRLPGVPLLQSQTTGPEYSRWRRSIKFGLEAKGTWKYCNGQCPMPMPEAATSPTQSTANPQPSLLEERRDWVRHDREVKLDIFLSLAEEVMQEVLEVGPPLPPSNLNAQEMLEALDERFAVFKFEAYHHAFCHFLNLHIDQYPSIAEFNQEFSTTLEDLLDHGHPLSNIQACSAYFSKLRCTQNPWVAKKLEEWDARSEEIQYTDLLRESPPWSFVRPLVMKPSQTFHVESIPEEYLEDSSASDSDAPSEISDSSTVSSISVRFRQTSNTTVNVTPSQDGKTERQESVATIHSQEIIIRASSEDIAEIKPQALRTEPEKLSASAIPERGSSKNQVPGTPLTNDLETPLPEWLAAKKSVARRPPPLPLDRPLPPLPSHSVESNHRASHSRSGSPRALATASKKSSQASLTAPTSAQVPSLKLETTHPTLRPTTPTPPVEVHPALRTAPSASTEHLAFHHGLQPLKETLLSRPSSAKSEQRRPSVSTPNLAIPWPSTPDIATRPHSSRANLPFSQAPNPLPSQAQAQPHTPPRSQQGYNDDDERGMRRRSSNGSEISLPLQGTRDSAWAYLYESKGGYLITREHSVSPVSSSTPPQESQSLYTQSLLTQSLHRVPTFEDTIVPRSMSPEHKKSNSLDFMTRLSGDSLLESSEDVKEREKKHRKKKSWVNVNLARFSAKGVKEMI